MTKKTGSALLQTFAELGSKIKQEELLRLEIKKEFDEVTEQLKLIKPKTNAEKLHQLETFLKGMLEGYQNLSDYNDKQTLILEDFKKLLEGDYIQ